MIVDAPARALKGLGGSEPECDAGYWRGRPVSRARTR